MPIPRAMRALVFPSAPRGLGAGSRNRAAPAPPAGPARYGAGGTMRGTIAPSRRPGWQARVVGECAPAAGPADRGSWRRLRIGLRHRRDGCLRHSSRARRRPVFRPEFRPGPRCAFPPGGRRIRNPGCRFPGAAEPPSLRLAWRPEPERPRAAASAGTVPRGESPAARRESRSRHGAPLRTAATDLPAWAGPAGRATLSLRASRGRQRGQWRGGRMWQS